METELISFVTNQGLAVVVSIFLIRWVTTEVSKVLSQISEKLKDVDDKVSPLCIKVDQIHEAVIK